MNDVMRSLAHSICIYLYFRNKCHFEDCVKTNTLKRYLITLSVAQWLEHGAGDGMGSEKSSAKICSLVIKADS